MVWDEIKKKLDTFPMARLAVIYYLQPQQDSGFSTTFLKEHLGSVCQSVFLVILLPI